MISKSSDSLEATMHFSSRDWAANSEDAWIYGIVIGWDEPSLVELAEKFRWTQAAVDRLRALNADFLSRN